MQKFKWLLPLSLLVPLLMAPSGGFPPQFPGAQINARAFGVVCDGATDDLAAFTAAIAAVPAGGSLYIPPSATMCELSAAIVINKLMTVYAPPGSVFLQAKTGNVSAPVLMDVTASGVTVSGLGFDGGGAAFANTNVVVRDNAAANSVLFNQIAVQNTRGIGLAFLTVTNSGVTYSNFNNIGMLWATSLLAADRHQAIVFTNATAVKNYAIGNYFKNIGLDAISGTGQTGWVVAENRCDLSTAQTAQAFGNWPACVFGGNNTGAVIVNNVSDSAPGNGIDMSSPTTDLIVDGNFVIGSGGSGVSISGVTNFTITGNTLVGNGLNTTSCNRSGVDFLDAVTRGTVSSNVMTSNATFGVFAFTACSHVATLTNVLLDANNVTVGNTSGAYGGALTPPQKSSYGLATQSAATTCSLLAASSGQTANLASIACVATGNQTITFSSAYTTNPPLCVVSLNSTIASGWQVAVTGATTTTVSVVTAVAGTATNNIPYAISCTGT